MLSRNFTVLGLKRRFCKISERKEKRPIQKNFVKVALDFSVAALDAKRHGLSGFRVIIGKDF